MSVAQVEWQLKQFEEHYKNVSKAGEVSSQLEQKAKRKDRQQKKKSLNEIVRKERKKQIDNYKQNLKIVKQKKKPALVDKQKQLLSLLTQNK